MRSIPGEQAPEERSRNAHDEDVLRELRRDAQLVLRVARDVKVRHDVAEEAREGRGGEQNEQLVVEGGEVEELARRAGAREGGRADEQGREGEGADPQGDEAHHPDCPGEAAGSGDLVEGDDVGYAACFHDSA